MTCKLPSCRDPFAKRLSAWFAVLVLVVGGCSSEPHPAARPFGSSGDGLTSKRPKNVILISLDTCRADHLSSYGYSKPTTPNIDAVASRGVLFARAQSTNPITLPAHSSMLTGTLPPVHGVRDNYDYKLKDTAETLAEVLREQGFQTAAFVGAFPVANKFGLGQGFDVYDDQFARRQGPAPARLERPANEVTAAAIAWVEQHRDKPFFLFVHYFDPHAPYQPPKEFGERFSRDPYAAEIAFTDDQIGRLLEKLSQWGIYDDAMIVITSDHGESLGEHGEETHSFFIYQSTQHVPLVVQLPGCAAGTRIDEPVSIIDIMPTVLGSLGVDAPDANQGLDLRPYLAGEAPATVARPIYIESLVPTMFGCAPLRSVVRGRWQYIWTVKPELYDLVRDPRQETNLFEDHAREVSELHEELAAAMAATGTTGRAASQAGSNNDRARLQSLGYVGGSVSEVVELHPDMRDPKDFIELYHGLMQAEGFIGAGRFDEAKRVCEMLLASEPDIFRAEQMLAKIAQIQKRPDDAIAHYQQAIAIAKRRAGDVDDPDTRVAVDVADAYTALGEMLFRRKEFAPSLTIFNEGAERFPTYTRLATQRAAAMIEIALASDSNDDQQKQLGEAKAALHVVLEQEPQNADAHNFLGYAYLMTDDIDRARKHINAAIRWNPNHPASRANLERLRAYRGSNKSDSKQ